MANSKHSVEETGRAGFRPPDLRKTQEIIDSAKSSMITFDIEDESTTSSTCDPLNVNEIRKRNIFSDFARKFESKQKTKSEIYSNVNTKSNELFDGILRSDDDGLSETSNEDDERENVRIDEETLLDNDLNALSSKLDGDNRMVSKLN